MPDTRRPVGARRVFGAIVPLGLVVLIVTACGAPTASVAPSIVASPSSPSASPSVSPSLEPAASASPGLSGIPAGQPGSQTVQPTSASAVVGASETITVFTHCGFAGRLDWAGSFWQETGRSPDGGPIGDPEDTGSITLLSPTTAKFVSSTGTVVVLERLPGPVELAPCD
jgi:hypothetical protein